MTMRPRPRAGTSSDPSAGGEAAPTHLRVGLSVGLRTGPPCHPPATDPPSAREVIDKFEFDTQIARLDKAGLLYQVVAEFADLDLHPDVVSNEEMGHLYEELIRRFAELSNETAGEHFTPRDVIELMVNLLFIEDDDALTKPRVVRTVYDPAAGTGGMLATADKHLRSMNPDAILEVFGQELNAETYAVCRSDMMLKGQNAENIAFGNSFTHDAFPHRTFDYMLANPPFGVDWGKYARPVRDEHDRDGFDGRFGAGLPRKSDGSMLFLQQMTRFYHSQVRPIG